MLLLRDELQLTVSPQQESHFLCKPRLQCFDPKVKGNVGNHGKPTFDVATRFNEHYFLETGGRYYDPCMMAVYQSKDGCVGQRVRAIGGGAGELYKAGIGKALVILHLLRNCPVPGFDSVWEILLPTECKTVLDQRNFQAVKDDLEVKTAKLLRAAFGPGSGGRGLRPHHHSATPDRPPPPAGRPATSRCSAPLPGPPAAGSGAPVPAPPPGPARHR